MQPTLLLCNLHFTLPQTATYTTNKNTLWWMCVPSEDIIMIKCIFICAILIWAFGVGSHTQSHEVRKVKWCCPSKDHVLHGMDKIIYETVFVREKWMSCGIKASGAWSTTHVLLVFLDSNGCLSFILLPQSSDVSTVCALFVNWLSP